MNSNNSGPTVEDLFISGLPDAQYTKYAYMSSHHISYDNMIEIGNNICKNGNLAEMICYSSSLMAWAPFIVKANKFSMEEIVNLAIDADEISKRVTAISPTMASTNGPWPMVIHILKHAKFTTSELSELLNYACSKATTEYDARYIKENLVLSGMANNQNLDEKFVYDNCLDLCKDTTTCTKALRMLIPALPDQEGFIKRYMQNVDMIDLSTIFEETVLSDEFIINYLEANKLHMDDEEERSEKHRHSRDVKAIALYRRFSPKLIKYFTDNGYTSILDCYNNESFISKSVEYKKDVVNSLHDSNKNIFECHEDYFYGYKAVDNDNTSYHSLRFQYNPGETYETVAYGGNMQYGPGFYVCDMDTAKEYGEINTYNNPFRPYKIIKVKVYYDDVAHVNFNGTSVGCSKLTVCED